MRSPRRAAICLVLPLLGACGEMPTDSTWDYAPQFGAGSPHFVDGTGSTPTIDGNMAVTFKIAGLGSKASSMVTASADASGLWGCMTSVAGEFDWFPAVLRSASPVSVSTPFSNQNGNLSGVVVLPPAPSSLQCLRPSHRLVPITATFANVRLSHPDATTFNIDGLFDVQNYFLTFEVVPSITSVVLDETTLVIDGAPTAYTVTINNTGIDRTQAVVQGWIRQGTTYRGAFGSVVLCPGLPMGTLAGGDCTFSVTTAASNDPIVTGNGDLVAGPAVFELHLEVGTSSKVLAGFPTLITLSN